MNPITPFYSPPVHAGRLLSVPATVFQGPDAIAGFVEKINRLAPSAKRRIHGGNHAASSWKVSSVRQVDEGDPDSGLFMAEVQSTVGMEVINHDPEAGLASCSVVLPISGSLRLQMYDGEEVVARAGEGLMIDPARVRGTNIAPGTHFVEFDLAKGLMRGMAAEMGVESCAAAGAEDFALRFAPLLNTGLSQRLLLMATQAAGILQDGSGAAASRPRFQRWVELLALTLLAEQRMEVQPPSRMVLRAGASAALRRALDFIHGHVESDIGLPDIAAAACVSVSSLLRLFNSHLDQTPGAYLRQLRLDRARAELCEGNFGSVRELALRWGFQNSSKFSQAFLRRFGELPSRTCVAVR